MLHPAASWRITSTPPSTIFDTALARFMSDEWREEDDSVDGFDEPIWKRTDIDFSSDKCGDEMSIDPLFATNSGNLIISGSRLIDLNNT